jgi:nucleotide-binding universal stress UspA family protein
MGYASVMVYVDDFGAANARIELACDLADLFEAGLIGISASVPETPLIDPYTGAAMPPEVWAEEREAAAAEVKRAEARFRNVAGARRSLVSWRGAVDNPAELVAREARAADLIVVGRPSAQISRRSALDPGDVVMAAGRPVLVVPPETPKSKIFSRVLVAWRDSRESRRAVIDALPVLLKAEQVTVVGISEFPEEEEAIKLSVNDVTSFIRLHGVAATPLALSHAHETPAKRLIDCALSDNAGLIVLGGYGHARAREWAFGGVTRSLLKTSPLCCLFSH